MKQPKILSKGFYVQLEDCRPFFGQTFLRESRNPDGTWNDEYSTTQYENNATYWQTEEEAIGAYNDWLQNSKSKLAEVLKKPIDKNTKSE